MRRRRRKKLGRKDDSREIDARGSCTIVDQFTLIKCVPLGLVQN
jgi:hypothetical protein